MQVCPVDKQGFINEKEIYQLAYVTLKLPLNSLDDITPLELFWLIEGDNNEKRQYYEMISHSMKIAYASVQSGKNIPLFEKEVKKVKSITREEKKKGLSYLQEKFGE